MGEPDGRAVVLVVDDEPQHQKALAYLFRRAYRVLTAGSGAEAIRVADGERLDAILCDYRMPPPEGLEVLAHLERTQPECLRFLVTAHGDAEILREAINTGAVYRFVSKPIDLSALEVDLKRALEHQASRRQARRAEHLALAGTLASIAVHDMRNGLQGLSLLPALLDAGGAEDLAQAKEIAEWARSTMAGCIQEILTVAKGERPQLALAATKLPELAEKVLTQYRGLYPQLTFTLEAAASAPSAMVSPRHVERTLSNLVLNAVHVSPTPGTVTVRVAAAGACVRMAVEDQGPGMSPELQAKVLEGLFTTKGEGGVGLGIKQARGTLDAHGGRLLIDSAPGAGCRMLMDFPAAPA